MRATVIADASFCPRTRAGGWAVWITINTTYVNGAPRVLRIKRYGTFHTRPAHSTEAELWAAYNGIWLAYHEGARDILVQTDCMAVVQGGHRAVARQHWPQAHVRWRHVKGHTSHDEPRYYVNRWCDRHARREMRRQREQA